MLTERPVAVYVEAQILYLGLHIDRGACHVNSDSWWRPFSSIMKESRLRFWGVTLSPTARIALTILAVALLPLLMASLQFSPPATTNVLSA